MADIESPCNKVCIVDSSSNLCIGCGRNFAEIGGWLHFSPEQRVRIMTELPERLSMLTRRRASAGIT